MIGNHKTQNTVQLFHQHDVCRDMLVLRLSISKGQMRISSCRGDTLHGQGGVCDHKSANFITFGNINAMQGHILCTLLTKFSRPVFMVN